MKRAIYTKDCHDVMPLCRYNVAKQLGIATLTLEKDGFSLEPSLKYNFQTQHAQPILAISQKKGADTLKAAYDIEGEIGTLEWIRKPYKVCISSFLPFAVCHLPIAFCSHLFMKAAALLHSLRDRRQIMHMKRPAQYTSCGMKSLLAVAAGQVV